MDSLYSFSGKHVLILGFGREGVSTLKFLRKKFPKQEFLIADVHTILEFPRDVKEVLRSEKHIQTFFGKDYLQSIQNADIIVKSSGINPALPEIHAAIAAGKVVTSNIEIFFEECKGTIIGITGSKGKGTTTSAIYHVLKSAGLPVRLAGNIGIAALNMLEGHTAKDIFVLELSSFQLMTLKKSPYIAVVQNIFPAHIDYHGTFDEYVNAKRHIVQYQNKADYVVYNNSHPLPKEFAQQSPAHKIPFGALFLEDNGAFLEDEYIMYHVKGKAQKIIPRSEIALIGNFNIENILPAVVVAKIFKISNKVIAGALKSFKPLEHRLEFVAEKRNIRFYNDSLATVPEATIAAIHAFAESNAVLIAGGHDNQQQFDDLAETILAHQVKALVLFKPTGQRIWDALMKHAKATSKLPQHVFASDMEDAVSKAMQFAAEHDVVVMSPASPSFGLFKDYADRGAQFKREVGRL